MESVGVQRWLVDADASGGGVVLCEERTYVSMYRRMQNVCSTLGSVSWSAPTLLVIRAKLTAKAAPLCCLLPSTGSHGHMHLTTVAPSASHPHTTVQSRVCLPLFASTSMHRRHVQPTIFSLVCTPLGIGSAKTCELDTLGTPWFTVHLK